MRQRFPVSTFCSTRLIAYVIKSQWLKREKESRLTLQESEAALVLMRGFQSKLVRSLSGARPSRPTTAARTITARPIDPRPIASRSVHAGPVATRSIHTRSVDRRSVHAGRPNSRTPWRVTPAVPARWAAPTEASAPMIPTPIPTRPTPTIEIPAIPTPTPSKLSVFDRGCYVYSERQASRTADQRCL